MRLNPAGAQVLRDLLSDSFANARNGLQPTLPADLSISSVRDSIALAALL